MKTKPEFLDILAIFLISTIGIFSIFGIDDYLLGYDGLGFYGSIIF